jgi:hypothetical protein
VGAFAYTRGKDIFIGPGQEKHLMHEAWHVVQQMQGRVNPTIQLQGHSINDDKGLEREADVMGAKAGEIGKQFHHTEFRAQLANAAGAITDDRPFTSTLRQSIQRVPRPLRESITDPGTKPVIQRVAKWVAGTETATTNLAAHVISGKRDMGFTPPTLNGTAAMSAANAQGALKPPTIVTTPNADGTHSSKVDSVDTNEASYTMSLPGPGPWSTVTAKAKVVALFSSLGLAAQAACAAAGDTTFTFNGKPNDKDFADNVKTHEKIHASDHKIGFDHVIVPWDKKLEDAKTAGTTFNGANAPAAQAALFKAMGGTPNEIATAQLNEWVRLNNITHKGKTLATGATATPSNSAADPTCSTSSIDAT